MIIASLCFSVGEGLRLRPFPVILEQSDNQLSVNTSQQKSLNRYGPVDLPTRLQSRGKRQAEDLSTPPAQECNALTAYQVLLRNTAEDPDIVSVQLLSSSTGRAPPSNLQNI